LFDELNEIDDIPNERERVNAIPLIPTAGYIKNKRHHTKYKNRDSFIGSIFTSSMKMSSPLCFLKDSIATKASNY